MLLYLDRQVVDGDEVESIGHGAADAATAALAPAPPRPTELGYLLLKLRRPSTDGVVQSMSESETCISLNSRVL